MSASETRSASRSWTPEWPEWVAKKLYERGVEKALEELIVERESNIKRLNPQNIPSDIEQSTFFTDEYSSDYEDPKIICDIDLTATEIQEYLDCPNVYEEYGVYVCDESQYCELPYEYWRGYRRVYLNSEIKERVLFELKQFYPFKKYLLTKHKHPLFEPRLVQCIQKLSKIPEDIYKDIKQKHPTYSELRDFPNQAHYCQLIKY